MENTVQAFFTIFENFNGARLKGDKQVWLRKKSNVADEAQCIKNFQQENLPVSVHQDLEAVNLFAVPL